MTQTITAHFDGKVLIPDGPVQLPVGPSLRIHVDLVDSKRTTVEATNGIRDEDWPTDPEGITRLLELIASLEPLEMSASEEAEWKAARQAQNDHTLSELDGRIRRIEETPE